MSEDRGSPPESPIDAQSLDLPFGSGDEMGGTVREFSKTRNPPRKGRPFSTTKKTPNEFSMIGGVPASEVPFISEDPLKRVLAENNVGFAGFDTEQDTVPPELAEFLETHMGITGRSFNLILKRLPKGATSGGAEKTFVDSFHRTVPSMRHVMLEYGPGTYEFVVQWTETVVDAESGERKNKRQAEIVQFVIDESCELQYLEHQRMKRLQAQIRLRERAKQAREDNKLDLEVFGGSPDAPMESPREAAKAYLKEITDATEMLGFRKNGGGGLEWLKDVAPLLVPVVGAWMESQKQQAQAMQMQMNTMLTLLLSQSEKSSSHLLELVKATQGQGSGQTMMKEIKDMVFGAIDIREAINGKQPPSTADRVFGVIEGVLPQFLQLMAMNQQAREKDFRFKMAQQYVAQDPTMQEAMKNPVVFSELVQKLDRQYGWEQADGILSVIGRPRPADCPRDPGMQLPLEERKDGFPQSTGGGDEQGDEAQVVP